MRKVIRTAAALGIIIAAIAGGYFAYRAIAKNQVRAEIQAEQQRAANVSRLADPGSTDKLEILPLVEAEAVSADYQAEHGVSYLIKTDHARILLDLGQNTASQSPSPLEANMERLGVTTADFDILVISHHHPDHVGGQRWWLNSTFSLGNRQIDLGGKQVYVPSSMSYPGLAPVVASQPVKIADGVALIGSIPFLETMDTPGLPLRNHEQALAINVTGKGVVVITGCGHPTLPVLVRRAQALFDAPVVGVVGGLHLTGASAETIEGDIDLLKGLRAQIVGLSPHDSDASVISMFRQAFGDVYQDVKVGRTIRFGRD